MRAKSTCMLISQSCTSRWSASTANLSSSALRKLDNKLRNCFGVSGKGLPNCCSRAAWESTEVGILDECEEEAGRPLDKCVVTESRSLSTSGGTAPPPVTGIGTAFVPNFALSGSGAMLVSIRWPRSSKMPTKSTSLPSKEPIFVLRLVCGPFQACHERCPLRL